MATIKFSHKYIKMPANTENTRLCEVFKTHSKDLSGGFETYDTEYADGFYKLPKGSVLVLLLLTDYGQTTERMWTTVRRWTPDKETYYRGLRGQQVEIEINEEEA